MRKHWLAIASSFIAMHCGGMTRTTGNDLCIAGTQVECECGRLTGVRTCAADGVAYGACSCSADTDGGDDPKRDGASDAPPLVCTSKTMWTNGTSGSQDMTPGRACIDCHRAANSPRAPVYTAAGTIFLGQRDVDDCNGVNSSERPVALAFFSDNGGELFRLAANNVGNFFTTRALPAQYRVKLVSMGQESVMLGPVTNGDCNACHTAAGAFGATGRLTPPKP